MSFGSIPVNLLLVGRALGLIDGITKQLDPELDTLEIIAHYVWRHTFSLAETLYGSIEQSHCTHT